MADNFVLKSEPRKALFPFKTKHTFHETNIYSVFNRYSRHPCAVPYSEVTMNSCSGWKWFTWTRTEEFWCPGFPTSFPVFQAKDATRSKKNSRKHVVPSNSASTPVITRQSCKYPFLANRAHSTRFLRWESAVPPLFSTKWVSLAHFPSNKQQLFRTVDFRGRPATVVWPRISSWCGRLLVPGYQFRRPPRCVATRQPMMPQRLAIFTLKYNENRPKQINKLFYPNLAFLLLPPVVCFLCFLIFSGRGTGKWWYLLIFEFFSTLWIQWSLGDLPIWGRKPGKLVESSWLPQSEREPVESPNSFDGLDTIVWFSLGDFSAVTSGSDRFPSKDQGYIGFIQISDSSGSKRTPRAIQRGELQPLDEIRSPGSQFPVLKYCSLNIKRSGSTCCSFPPSSSSLYRPLPRR